MLLAVKRTFLLRVLQIYVFYVIISFNHSHHQLTIKIKASVCVWLHIITVYILHFI